MIFHTVETPTKEKNTLVKGMGNEGILKELSTGLKVCPLPQSGLSYGFFKLQPPATR